VNPIETGPQLEVNLPLIVCEKVIVPLAVFGVEKCPLIATVVTHVLPNDVLVAFAPVTEIRPAAETLTVPASISELPL
jgi:hypothetical protein